jgi:hypothetical protein
MDPTRISMTTMEPPQHGQRRHGSGSGSPDGVSGTVGWGTASNTRMRAMLSLRVALASSP